MSRGMNRWQLEVHRASKAAKAILCDEIGRLFKRHPRIGQVDVYMGTILFCDTHGRMIDFNKLPKLGKDIVELEGDICATVGSIGATWVNKDGKAVEVKREFY